MVGLWDILSPNRYQAVTDEGGRGVRALGDNRSMPTSATRFLTPQRLLMASVVVALITITLKTLAWYVTDSVGLLSDAMESLVNLASAIFGLVMVTIAARPADDDHPYGHHKAEYFSSGFEGILIIVAALGIVWTAVSRLLDPQPIEQVGWGLALSVASSALNGLLAWVMFGAARAHRSIALEADAKHLVTDVWTSAGVVCGGKTTREPMGTSTSPTNLPENSKVAITVPDSSSRSPSSVDCSTIVAISSIHLLQIFLNSSQYTDNKLMWLTIMHMAFVFSALFLAYIDRVMSMTKKDKGGSG